MSAACFFFIVAVALAISNCYAVYRWRVAERHLSPEPDDD